MGGQAAEADTGRRRGGRPTGPAWARTLSLQQARLPPSSLTHAPRFLSPPPPPSASLVCSFDRTDPKLCSQSSSTAK